MESSVKWRFNNLPKMSEEEKEKLISFLSIDEITKAKKFHESIPNYEPTPLVSLQGLAKKLGVKAIYIKDESYRFGLNAFKVLGGSFAMAKYLADKLGKDISELPYDVLVSDETRKKLGEITFVTATDGNHGRGVAWTANRLKQKSIVYMPYGSSEIRLSNILAENANASITDFNYDECVRLADKYQKAHPDSSVVVQDTAWEGYEEIPAWIMQGYGTMALETFDQLKEEPTHIFVQAGVGSFASAIQGLYASKYGDKCPKVTVLESDVADCLYQSAVAGDGKARFVGGAMQTLMAGLACGEPNTTGWEILKNYSTCFASVSDNIAANGMRVLAAPTNGDTPVKSGESGAAPTGLLYEILTSSDLLDLRNALGLNSQSVVLLFSTEGDTDPEMYEEVVYKGRNKK